MTDRTSGREPSFARTWERRAVTFLTDPVPEEVLEHGALTVADVLVAAVAGAGIETIDGVGRNAAFGEGSSSILGSYRQVNAGQAALVNEAAAIAHEIEEGHNAGGHVMSPIVTAGFALAEQLDVAGETFVEACVKAYELQTRLQGAMYALQTTIAQETPWKIRNPHSTFTTVGSAISCAMCLGQSERKLRETFRVALNLAVVSMHDPVVEGSPSRNFTSGFSSQAGLNVALATDAGLTGSAEAVRTVYDPFRTGTVRDLDRRGQPFDRWFDRLGDDWEMARNYFKVYPSCHYTNPPVDALGAIIDEVDVASIKRVDVHVPTAHAATKYSYTGADTLTGAKFSIPYVVAQYLVSGDLWLEQFEERALRDEAVRDLERRVSIHVDPTYEKRFPERWSTRVDVVHEDGRTESAEVTDPLGDHRNPLSEDQLVEKFRRLLAWRFDGSQTDRSLDAVLDIRERDVRSIGAALRGA